MPHTIYSAGSYPVQLPGRTVQTFPSGLVRVERSFAVPAAQAGTFRPMFAVGEPMPFDDGAPAIDGLYIFPEPQEIASGDGFVQFRVTAYGRTNILGSFNKRVRLQELLIQAWWTFPLVRQLNKGQKSAGSIIIADAIHQFCVPTLSTSRPQLPEGTAFAAFEDTGEKIENFGVVPSVFFPEITGFVDQEGFSADRARLINTKIIATDGSRSNFGFWDEYTITYQTQVVGNLLGIFVNRQSIGFTNDPQNIISPETEFQIAALGPSSIQLQYEIAPNSDSAIISVSDAFPQTRIMHTSYSGPGFSATRSGLFMNVGIGGLTPLRTYTLNARYANSTTQSLPYSVTFATPAFSPTQL
jgi:hypothetical protein